jgi:hypothetical protein
MINYKITFKDAGVITTREFQGNNILDILGQFYEKYGNCWIVKIKTTDNY